MFMTISTFAIMGIIYYIMSYFVKGLWVYYIPSASLVVLLWLMIIIMRNKYVANNTLNNLPDLFSIEQKEMLLSCSSIFLIKTEFITLFARTEPDAASGYIMFISIGYAIYSIFLQNWLTFIISIFVIIILFTILSFSFPGGSDDDDFVRAVRRYCRSKKINRKKLARVDLEEFFYTYSEIIEKLKALHQGNRPNPSP